MVLTHSFVALLSKGINNEKIAALAEPTKNFERLKLLTNRTFLDQTLILSATRGRFYAC